MIAVWLAGSGWGVIMFTYVCLGTNDLERACVFYDAALGALGLTRCDTSSEDDWDGWEGWGTYQDGGRYELALWVCAPFDGAPATAGNGTKRWTPVVGQRLN